jgi:two-component system sporulation sensor kinase A
VLGDRGQLVQLFLNLLKNAVEAMPTGGTVTIRCTESDETVSVEVVDEGIGFHSSQRSNLFQPFFTTKPQGTGLGLSICREIADFHRAALDLVARTDAPGTTARVEFPSHALDVHNETLSTSKPEAATSQGASPHTS